MAKYFNIHAPRLRNHERVAVQGFLSSFKRFETIRYLNFVLHGKKRKDDNFLAYSMDLEVVTRSKSGNSYKSGDATAN
jgi:hypothetical protein